MSTDSALHRPATPTFVSLSDGRRLAYAEYGDPGGTPVTFLHGTPGSRVLAALFDDVAAAEGVRLLAYDRPGCGRSSPHPDRTLRDAGAALAAVLDDAGVATAGVVAFSGGAPPAVAATATHGHRIDRVDVVSGAVPAGLAEDTPVVQRLLGGLAGAAPVVLRGLLRGQAWVAARRDPSFVVAQYTTGDAASVPDRAAAVVRADFLAALDRHRSGAVAEFRRAATAWDDAVALADVDAAVRFHHGAGDANVPVADARRFVATAPDAELSVLDGADHLGALLRAVPDVVGEHGRRRA